MLTKTRKISFEGVKDTPYYKISSIILEKEDKFTFEDIKQDIQRSLNIQEQEVLIKKSLKKLRNNGLIIEHGSFYSKPQN